MIRELEADTFRFWTEFGHHPDGGHGDDNGATWFRSGVPFAYYNGVVGVGCDVDAMVARVRAWGVPARWLISSASAGSVEADFAQRGFLIVDQAPGMIARIKDLPEPHADGITVEVVTEERQRDEWHDAFADAFDFSPAVAACVREAHTWPSLHEPGRTYLLIRRDGIAVATGLLHWTHGVAGVYGIGVRRAFQRQGLGTLATLLTVREGAKRGATMAILQATKDGLPVYERLGFQTVCTFRGWQIA